MTPLVTKDDKLQHGTVKGHRIIRASVTISFVLLRLDDRHFAALPNPVSRSEMLAGLVECEPHALSDYKNERLKGCVSAAGRQQLCGV